MGDSKLRRSRGDGGYRKRGPDRWELKFSTVDPRTGGSRMRTVTFKGSETGARTKLRELVSSAGDAGFVATARQTFADAVNAWDRALNVSPKTAERYRELVKLQILPHLGSVRLHALRPTRIETFYRDLLTGRSASGAEVRPLASRTVIHIHRLLTKILSMAERDGLIPANPARLAERPRVHRTEIEILKEPQVRDLLLKLRGRRMYLIAALGLFTGMRRGELVALRWKDIDLDGAVLRVEQSLEQTKEGLRFKSPKTLHGRRSISLPASIVSELRAHRRSQYEHQMALGLGRDSDDTLVFRKADGEPVWPDSLSTEWRRLVQTLKLPKVTLHAWRHTHASQLIASGMDILAISRRLGHGAPSVTLNVYGHLFKSNDDRAAAVFETAFGKLFSE
jgi:integrase